MSFQPAENPAGVGVTFTEAYLPQCRSAVWPEVLSNEPDGGLHELGVYFLRLISTAYCPAEQRQGPGDAKRISRRLRPPLAFPPINGALTLVHLKPECLK